jgi:hypothetical protein
MKRPSASPARDGRRASWIWRLAVFAILASITSAAIIRRPARRASVAVNAQPGPLRFSIDPSKQFPISRFIYGANFVESRPWDFARHFPPFTLVRIGGNRLSAYNWENNFSNAGNDYLYENDDYLSDSRKPGDAVRTRVDAARHDGAGAMVTIPMIGYVAADNRGPMDVADATRATRLATRFKRSRSTKGAPFTLTPDANDDFVNQDEFVNWIDRTYPGAIADQTKPIMFSLDNEPDLWWSTHAEVFSKVQDRTPRLQSYDEFIATSIDYARAVKRVAPQALVFGPAVANWAGMAVLGRYPTPDPVYGTKYFLDIYLDQMKRASAQGPRLLDVLDVHWYPESQGSGVRVTENRNPEPRGLTEARVQAPRSLWDPTFDEHTWVSQSAGGPVMLLERMRQSVAAHFPGTKLAISEYYFGGGDQISGGVAQADVLGIFGREHVFAATIWPAADGSSYRQGDDGRAYGYVFGAFDMFLNYDGAGSRFGDVGVTSVTTDVTRSSVYGSLDAANRLVIVAINKTDAALPVTIAVAGRAPARAQAWLLAAGSPRPARQAHVSAANGQLSYTMPAMSVTTLVVPP